MGNPGSRRVLCGESPGCLLRTLDRATGGLRLFRRVHVKQRLSPVVGRISLHVEHVQQIGHRALSLAHQSKDLLCRARRVARAQRLVLAAGDRNDRIVLAEQIGQNGEMLPLHERHVARDEQDRLDDDRRFAGQGADAGGERRQRPFPRIVHGRKLRSRDPADRQHRIRYLPKFSGNADGERYAADLETGLVSSHAARIAAGEKEACRLDWLEQMITSLAEGTNNDAATLVPTPNAVREILDVARIASHTSGDRTNAPLLCYVLGVLSGRGVALGAAITIVKDRAGIA